MLPEISLHVLDIAENSVRAGASLVEIEVRADTSADLLSLRIADDGCGMSGEQLAKVTDPFFTTRDTRRIGLGVPFFKQAAELAGGTFSIRSRPGEGTEVCASFVLSHIDRVPLGDMSETIRTLITGHPQMDVLYTYACGDRSFQLDTREMRAILGDVPLDAAEVSAFLIDYLNEHTHETDGGTIY